MEYNNYPKGLILLGEFRKALPTCAVAPGGFNKLKEPSSGGSRHKAYVSNQSIARVGIISIKFIMGVHQMKRNVLFLAIPLALGLVACGGGGGTSGSAGFVSVMVTDALSTQYTKVWVTITKVTVQDGNGATVELFNDPAGQVFNLAELNGISSLLSTQSLAAGTYSNLTITLDPSVTLNNGSPTPTTATLSSNEIVVAGSFTVSGGATSIGIDFDLANFTYTPPVPPATVGTITPTLVLRDHNTMQSMAQAYAELEGTIKSVATNNTTDFVMTINNGAGATTDITVTLLGNATVYVDSGQSGQPTEYTDNQFLRDPRFIGQPVEVYGNYDSTTLHIDAIRVRAASSSQSDTDVFGNYKLEGLAVATLTGGKIQVDIREANFVAPGGSLIVDISNAKFDKGAASDFTNLSQTATLRVEMRGDWDGTIFTPKIVEIEGASRDRTSGTSTTGIIDHYVEVIGQVQGNLSADGKSFQISVLSKTHDDTGSSAASIDSAVNSNGVIDVNLSQGWFKSGRSACIVDQAYVEIKGSWTDQSVLNAHAIDVKGACSFSGNPIIDNHGLQMHPSVKGAISAIDANAGTLTLTIISAKGLTGVQVGDTITIDFGQSPLFDRGTAANLLANLLIEVDASSAAGWNANATTLTAAKIRFL